MIWAWFGWNIVLNVVTLVLAVVVTSKAPNDFEALVFLMALIAYHRLLLSIVVGHEENGKRGLLFVSWFHRLDGLIRNSEPTDPELRSWLAEIRNEKDLLKMKESMDILSKARGRAVWAQLVTELVLIVAVIVLLLR